MEVIAILKPESENDWADLAALVLDGLIEITASRITYRGRTLLSPLP